MQGFGLGLGLTQRRAGVSLRTLTELPDPTASSGLQVRLVGDAPSIVAQSDGTDWFNRQTGAKIDPWWLPHGAKLHADIDKGRFHWAGAVKTLSDLTAVAAGGYSLADGAGIVGEMTVVLEYTPATTPAVLTGTLFSMTSGYPAGNRIEFEENNNSTYGDGIRLYVSPGNPTANFQALDAFSKVGEGGAVWLGAEKHRICTRIKANTNHSWKMDDGQIRNSALGAGNLVAPTKIGFGCRAWAPGDPDNQFTGGTLNRVTLYNSSVPDAVLHAMGRSGQYWPVHLLGDSFLNLYGVLQRLRAKITASAGYLATSQDGVGGTTIVQEAQRYTVDYPDWHESTLVLVEMGLDLTYDDWEPAMRSILASLKNKRWLVLESAPNLDAGTPQRALADAYQAKIRDFCGGDYTSGGHFVPTLEAAMALSDGSAQDVAKVAARRWPTSLTISDTDFHPNRGKGDTFLAGQIYDALVAMGWAA